MSKYINTADQQWDQADIVGANMERCVLWNGGHNVFAGFFRMPAGMRLPLHQHDEWVQILVLGGRVRVTSKDGSSHIVAEGGYYFVEPGDAHTEEALEDALLLVIAQVGTRRAGTRVLP